MSRIQEINVNLDRVQADLNDQEGSKFGQFFGNYDGKDLGSVLAQTSEMRGEVSELFSKYVFD